MKKSVGEGRVWERNMQKIKTKEKKMPKQFFQKLIDLPNSIEVTVLFFVFFFEETEGRYTLAVKHTNICRAMQK